MRGKHQMPRMPRNLWIQKLQMCMPRNPMMSQKRKKINPFPIQKNARKRLKLYCIKNTKFGSQKKRAVIRKCSVCSEQFNSQKELNDHIASHYKYKLFCGDRRCGKTFRSLESLKKHQLHHRDMKFLCQVCRAKFPFALDLQVTKPNICKKKICLSISKMQ